MGDLLGCPCGDSYVVPRCLAGEWHLFAIADLETPEVKIGPGAKPDKHQWIRAKVDDLLDAAIAQSSTRFDREAINWGDLGVTRVFLCQDDENKWSWMVEIEELHSDCPELQQYLMDGMKALGIDNIEFRFHW